MKRRDTLRLLGAGAVALSGAPALIGCSSGGDSSDVTNEGKDLAPYPTYVPLVGPEPDLPGDETGVQNAYTKYPSQITSTGFGTPGDGSEVTASVITYGTPPTPVEQNQFHQAINAALGIKLKLDVIPAANFGEKMATMLAASDYPDIIFFGAGGTVAREEEFIATACQDLSEHISGDNIKQFPALANIPTYAWEGLGRIGGKLYGIPIERPVFGGCLMLNRTAMDAVDAPVEWDATSYATAMKAATSGKKYGVGIMASNNVDWWASGFGAPNTWSVGGDGSFTPVYGDDRYKEAIALLAQLFKDGAIHPDAGATSPTDMKTLFNNETVACYRDGWGAFSVPVLDIAKDKWTLDFGLPFAGGAPWGGSGRFGYTVLKKAEPERIKMLLNVANWLAAPFGTEEYELVNYGVEGTHFTRGDDGGPVATELSTNGENSTNLPFKYIAAAPQVIYYAGYPEAVERVYEWEKKVAPITVPNPANGIRSATWTEKGAALDSAINAAYLGVITGREDMAAYDAAVQKWLEDGGSAAAEEFAKEYAATR